jgi:hypothetical protein
MTLAEVEQYDALREKVEELHDDLKPYAFQNKALFCIHHPLMIVIPYFDREHNAVHNYNYKLKLEDLKMWEEKREWQRYVRVYERPYRLQAFMDIADKLTDAEYWDTASWIWIDTENQHEFISEWLDILSSDRGSKECFMDLNEQEFLKSLPDTVTIYRGCYEDLNEEGLSWTLDKKVAEMFSQHKYYNRNDWTPVVLEQTVNKKDIFAVKLGRKESEVILNNGGY